MAILAFQKPEKVIMLESTSEFGKFEFRPLEPGFGMTIGNALRRILLSSLEGYAITNVRITGVDHEFAAIPGVMEGVIDIILNLKQVRFIRTVENVDTETVTINVAGQSELTAGNISNFMTNFKVLNPDLVICHLTPETKLQMELTINKGRGYVPRNASAIASGISASASITLARASCALALFSCSCATAMARFSSALACAMFLSALAWSI